MPVVYIITTGGTIASRVDLQTGGAVPAIHADELIAQVPELADIAEIRTIEFSFVASWNITPWMMADLARTIHDVLSQQDVAGVVVTHGTDTMEETAFALDLLLDTPAPVVLTGAMRNAGLPGPDGPRNLLTAVRVAADPAAKGLGVLVAMNDEVHAARHVTKTHTTALHTFASPEVGPVALLDDAGLWIRWRPASSPHLSIADPERRVYLIKMAAGMDGMLLLAVLDAGGRGVVIEGSGSGNVYGVWEESIEALTSADVPVVLVSRCVGGRIVPTYGGPGGGQTLHALGVVPGGDLSGPKARLALMFALGAGLDVANIRRYFGLFANNNEANKSVEE